MYAGKVGSSWGQIHNTGRGPGIRLAQAALTPLVTPDCLVSPLEVNRDWTYHVDPAALFDPKRRGSPLVLRELKV